ncbi:bifunctional diaminohydroxyphosphoribosylaminopyrimidine deaminase/5-amino-6-(5-phosphoribosylamino)uracil reductase RibD [Deinococcus cellulosilyticus]|uniref:Riboflavin biosynthesis protein RibD n=1 Tax=Deinococcus cellulosilyticus (strain DSM 18568 / NBRC 106333 / KACC 11606 / 5516J-15) TaxID=1223518 RepID=A0A511MXD1_DEIC1|nr:bifunctional diaminohydroxyphosphoribosylaminopyrimidine deaminase/5-amino-6-(5-phosphoribosylamino)uracil reductase RibD [Deinococcus cellulosilyticus]GEM44928.1 riboflavin biosynthesis protein RibD [Deinococcus cellulosilyticus NBRC 106333 = KACC 11606]
MPPHAGKTMLYQKIFSQDTLLMQEALSLAAQALGRTSPNPPVGCVIVKDDHVIGRGFHPKAGEPHAEVFALRDAGFRAEGATAYVTLEPCSHHGRTPPCADALIAAKVQRVVIAALDPNPLVAGKGVQKLLDAGIQVDVGVLQDQAIVQQAGFRTRITHGRPRVTYKYAQSLDGKMASQNGRQLWLTGQDAKRRVHELRNQMDAIAVGSNTVLSDNPLLTTRLEGVTGTRDPIPVIFDRSGRVPLSAKAMRPGAIVVTESQQEYPDFLKVIRTTHLPDVLQELGKQGINTLLLEGGPDLASAFLKADLIDDLLVFIAPRIMGTGRPSLWTELEGLLDVQELKTEQVGKDVLLSARIHPIPQVEAD